MNPRNSCTSFLDFGRGMSCRFLVDVCWVRLDTLTGYIMPQNGIESIFMLHFPELNTSPSLAATIIRFHSTWSCSSSGLAYMATSSTIPAGPSSWSRICSLFISKTSYEMSRTYGRRLKQYLPYGDSNVVELRFAVQLDWPAFWFCVQSGENIWASCGVDAWRRRWGASGPVTYRGEKSFRCLKNSPFHTELCAWQSCLIQRTSLIWFFLNNDLYSNADESFLYNLKFLNRNNAFQRCTSNFVCIIW